MKIGQQASCLMYRMMMMMMIYTHPNQIPGYASAARLLL